MSFTSRVSYKTAPGLTNDNLTGHMINVCEERGDSLALIDLANVYIPKAEAYKNNKQEQQKRQKHKKEQHKHEHDKQEQHKTGQHKQEQHKQEQPKPEQPKEEQHLLWNH